MLRQERNSGRQDRRGQRSRGARRCWKDASTVFNDNMAHRINGNDRACGRRILGLLDEDLGHSFIEWSSPVHGGNLASDRVTQNVFSDTTTVDRRQQAQWFYNSETDQTIATFSSFRARISIGLMPNSRIFFRSFRIIFADVEVNDTSSLIRYFTMTRNGCLSAASL